DLRSELASFYVQVLAHSGFPEFFYEDHSFRV
ncbi:hypothetical protein G827_00062, partial [Escherichia coli HVH 172 (4-3248542)]